MGLEEDEEARGPEEKELLVASLALGRNGLVTDRHKRFRGNLSCAPGKSWEKQLGNSTRQAAGHSLLEAGFLQQNSHSQCFAL